MVNLPAHTKHNIKDGPYRIITIGTVPTQTIPYRNIVQPFLQQLSEDYNGDEYNRIIIDTSEFVPLELEKAPITEQQTENKRSCYFPDKRSFRTT